MCVVLVYGVVFFVLMIRRPPRSTLDRSSAASDVYKRQALEQVIAADRNHPGAQHLYIHIVEASRTPDRGVALSLIHISEPTRPY